MATLIVPDVDEASLVRLRDELERQGGSVEAEVRLMIAERAQRSETERRRRALEAAAGLRAYRKQRFDALGEEVGSVEWVRQDRAAW